MANNFPIGLFDSGIGGLSIYNEIKKSVPNESTIYIADNLNAPYGKKTETEIIQLSIKNTQKLVDLGAHNHSPDDVFYRAFPCLTMCHLAQSVSERNISVGKLWMVMKSIITDALSAMITTIINDNESGKNYRVGHGFFGCDQ